MPPLKDTATAYGVVSIAFHWLSAVAVIGLFALGWWMVDLDYYDPWYRRAPELHKAIGMLLLPLLLLRLGWRRTNTTPDPEPGSGPVGRRLARLVHRLLYLLPFAVLLCGYLISTADGRPISLFGLFEVPAALSGLPNQADLAGALHRYLAYGLIGVAALHALAALKHHFIDRDRTLAKMLGIGPTSPSKE